MSQQWEDMFLMRRIEEQWNAMLKRLADRDGAVELSRGENKDGAESTYNSRVFQVQPEDGCIIVETPRQAVYDRAFRIGDDIDLTLMVKHERMVATCTLQEVFSLQLNPTLSVTSYRLSAGRRPVRDQRRSYYRVNVAGMELEPIKLTSELEDEGCFDFTARLFNISASGIGVSVRASRSILNQIKRTRHFHCSAHLNDEQSIDAPARIAYINALGDDGLHLGLRFDIEDEAEAMNHEQYMQHRCTEIQRMQLRRRRA